VIILTPYRQDRDLGIAYNQAMAMIPDGGHGCLMDIDAMFLTPEQPAIIERYVDKFPEAVLTCYTNRISPISKQLYGGMLSENANIRDHIIKAKKMQEQPLSVKMIGNTISGFLMVIPKSVWEKVTFIEGIGCLGVDTWFSKELRKQNIPILLMETVYVWHSYRIDKGVKNKDHLICR
jgi:GT2 family glycosyltransferase